MRLSDIHNISIKWKLIIPFLFLAFLGTSSLIFVSIRFQRRVFHAQEKLQLHCFYQNFLNGIQEKQHLALTFANEVSANPLLQESLAQKKINTLRRFCDQSHQIMKGCLQSFGWNFHLMDKTGKELPVRDHHDSSSYFLHQWFKNQEHKSGLAVARKRIFMWGAVPVFYNNHIVGATAITIPLDKQFLDQRTSLFHVNYSLLIPVSASIGAHFLILASTKEKYAINNDQVYSQIFKATKAQTLFTDKGKNRRAVLITPLKDANGKPIALLEISADRGSSLQLFSEYKRDMLIVGLTGFLLSLAIIFWITAIFTKPIGDLVMAAQEITSGKHIKSIKPLYADEIGVLANSLNDMLQSLEESHRQIQDYALNLEKKVQERAKALKDSEEKYRTLVENVPLVVYRTDMNGEITFINQYIKSLLGFSPDEIIHKKDFFHNRIIPEDRERIINTWDECLKEGKKFEMEYRVMDRNNQLVYVLDQGIPFIDSEGIIRRVDGILIDITDSKKLQDKILQSEELQALKEISSRLAHEIRNPLTIAGGFTRQLLKTFPTKDPRRKKLAIIASEIEKLENILRITLTYIKPRSLNFRKTNLNKLLEPLLFEYQKHFSRLDSSLEIDLNPQIPPLNLDAELFYQVVKNIFDLILSFIPSGTKCSVLSYSENSFAVLSISLEESELQKEKLDTLLHPFTSHIERGEPLSLPLAKIIIQKHNGLLKINQLSENQVQITISIPINQRG